MDVTFRRIDELEGYQGQFLYAGKGLGVTAWGMNVIKMPPRWTHYPEHDHAKDGQEEVYVVLAGSATLRAGDRQWPLDPGCLVRVGPTQRRKIIPSDNGVTLLAIGGVPGKASPLRPDESHRLPFEMIWRNSGGCMAYNEPLAQRLQALSQTHRGFTHKKMFGGMGFLLNGNMCVGVYRNYLILRLGKEVAERALGLKYTKPFDITGRPMAGWVMIEAEGTGDDNILQEWLVRAIDFVQTLPSK